MKKYLLVVLSLVLTFTASFANGVAIVDAVKPLYLRLDSTTVAVSVIGQISKTISTQYFTNTHTVVTGSKYGFPLAEQASAVQLRWKSGAV